MNKDVKIYDGIYFGLDEDAYIAIERLSKSGMKKLRTSPADFWHESWLNPDRPDLTPEQERVRQKARLIGRAYHAARLEPEKFAEQYVRELSQADYAGTEGFISTGADMKAALKNLGEKQTGNVGEQAQRLAAAGHKGPIWHLEKAAWEAKVRADQVVIPAKDYEEILVDMERLKKAQGIDDLLSGGAAEVSVLWTCEQTGIKMKARFDYLKAGEWVEFKTFANPGGKNLRQCIMDAVQYNRYHIDAVSYLEAANAIKGLAIQGEASDAQKAIVEQIKARPAGLDCQFVFQQKGGVPNILSRKFRFFDVPVSTKAHEAGLDEDAKALAREKMGRRTAVHIKAAMEIKMAKRDFAAYSEIYQRGDPWLPFDPAGEITDADFRPYWLEDVN